MSHHSGHCFSMTHRKNFPTTSPLPLAHGFKAKIFIERARLQVTLGSSQATGSRERVWLCARGATSGALRSIWENRAGEGLRAEGGAQENRMQRSLLRGPCSQGPTGPAETVGMWPRGPPREGQGAWQARQRGVLPTSVAGRGPGPGLSLAIRGPGPDRKPAA